MRIFSIFSSLSFILLRYAYLKSATDMRLVVLIVTSPTLADLTFRAYDIKSLKNCERVLYFTYIEYFLRGLGFAFKFLVLVVHIVVNWLIDAADRHTIVHTVLIDHEGQGVLGH